MFYSIFARVECPICDAIVVVTRDEDGFAGPEICSLCNEDLNYIRKRISRKMTEKREQFIVRRRRLA